MKEYVEERNGGLYIAGTRVSLDLILGRCTAPSHIIWKISRQWTHIDSAGRIGSSRCGGVFRLSPTTYASA